jgi:DNA-binding NarL/FixJ family response regulator
LNLTTLPKIAVVESNCFYRRGLCITIQNYEFAELAFEAANGMEFFDKQLKTPADIVLIDTVLPVMDGYRVVQESKKLFPDIKIIILTVLDEDETIQLFIQQSVQGYLLKNIDSRELELAIKAVINGQECYSKEVMDFFTRKHKERSANPKNRSNLTKRELLILQLIFEGYTNQEIADKLFISIRTVTNHRFNLNVKTGAKNTAGLISYGLKNKLIHYVFNSMPIQKYLYL